MGATAVLASAGGASVSISPRQAEVGAAFAHIQKNQPEYVPVISTEYGPKNVEHLQYLANLSTIAPPTDPKEAIKKYFKAHSKLSKSVVPEGPQETTQVRKRDILEHLRSISGGGKDETTFKKALEELNVRERIINRLWATLKSSKHTKEEAHDEEFNAFIKPYKQVGRSLGESDEDEELFNWNDDGDE